VKHEIVTYPLRTVKRDRIISVYESLAPARRRCYPVPAMAKSTHDKMLTVRQYPSGLVPQTRAFESGPGAVGFQVHGLNARRQVFPTG